MKFLVLALCVCAASAASFGSFGQQPSYKPFQQQPVASAYAQAVSSPAAVAPAAYTAAKTVFVDAPVYAAKAVYSASKDAESSILRSESEVNPDGFNYFYETNNGIAAQASGITKRVGNDDVIAVQGSYRYIGTDGKEVTVTYVADENGFQPQSDILPVGPAIPEAILRSLDYIRANYKPEVYKSDKY